jgi:transcription antitermination factor NusG
VAERAVAYLIEAMETNAEQFVESGLLPWFALRIKSNFEKVSSQILEQKGYEAFLPTYRTKNRWSDRTKIIDRPLFPGYVFCRFDQNNRLPILVTPGVVGVVGIGKTPMAVEEREIEAIQAILRSGLPATPWPFVTVGQRLLIERGPLSGVEGILQEIKNSYRFIVSVNLLQRSVAAEVDASWVRPVASREPLQYRHIA